MYPDKSRSTVIKKFSNEIYTMEFKISFQYLDGNFYEATGDLIKGKGAYVKTLKIKRYINGKIISNFITEPLAKIKIKSFLDSRINLL